MPGYRKLARIAVGGQATIHRGIDVDTGREVALKYLTPEGNRKSSPAEAGKERTRFLREVREQSRLRHANIMPVLGFSGRGQKPWYAMPLAKASLQDFLNSARLGIEWSLNVVHKIIDGMEYAHSEGVIHRDLKPNNILLAESEWMVSDFGFCRNMSSESLRITQPEKLVGTLIYAAPEQFDDAHIVGPTADVYSIGKILIHCLTWNMPPPGGNRLNEIPSEFKPTVIRCVAEDPEERFQKMADVRESLISAFEGTKKG
ncbi:serine/threonine protein kinase [Streptomyces sp. NBC_01450]|uniref:serine/threonine-protein kinase n=1 Tax=Streptomyces sp. NBC_01450 TaxID=2903871 RepID=UPI002E32ECCF|nr:serine/threonine-protein kinase [Streptomyces sp. NBC_01450]